MAKRNNGWNKQKLEKYLKEGRGQGELENYKPWTTIQDFSSMGRASRIKGWKTKRVHHFQSDISTRFFYLMEWEDKIIDIRESFPLLNLMEYLDEFQDLKLDAFKDKETDEPYILTTSFLLTINENGKHKYIARSIKNSYELDKKLTIEKFEIERRYWIKKQIDWGIVTEKEIPVEKSKNIEWIHSSLYDCEERGFSSNDVYELSINLANYLLNNGNSPIRELLLQYDNGYKLDSGAALFLFKHSVASKLISVDMNKNIDLSKTSQEIISKVNINTGGKDIVNC
ncbi:hypothetical protein B0H39_002798 [Clostridium beijerinckii]|uniref:TnsA endonuclease C-terminal domain-containing protein n=1 Tax=Clostridium beijerinckii TaxID=1520 RepID=UPI00149503FC|nr:hypothetical protein [Clostridium beijerinckii]